VVQSIYRDCLSLLSQILSRSEQMVYNDERDDEAVVTDEYHQRLSVVGCIRPKYSRDKDLPTRGQHMSSSFRRELAKAYGRDYGMPNIVGFHGSSLQWCKKLTFIDRTTQRCMTYKLGNFIQAELHGTANGPSVVEVLRLDHIFVHRFDRGLRLFILATRVDLSDRFDPVLGSGYRRGKVRHTSLAEPFIIGLPAMRSNNPYIVMVSDNPEASTAFPQHEKKLTLGKVEANDFIWAERTLVWL